VWIEGQRGHSISSERVLVKEKFSIESDEDRYQKPRVKGFGGQAMTPKLGPKEKILPPTSTQDRGQCLGQEVPRAEKRGGNGGTFQSGDKKKTDHFQGTYAEQ